MFRETSACPVFLLVSVSACETSHASLMKPVSRSTLKQVSASTVCTASQSLKPATGSRRNWFRGVRWTRYSAALPPHRNQRKTSHRNQQPTHNETSNTPHRDSPIPRSETSDTDLKHSRSTTFETSEKPHPKPATNPTPKPAHNPRQRPKRNQRNYNVHSAKAKAKSKADQTHPWRAPCRGASRHQNLTQQGYTERRERRRRADKKRRKIPLRLAQRVAALAARFSRVNRSSARSAKRLL